MKMWVGASGSSSEKNSLNGDMRVEGPCQEGCGCGLIVQGGAPTPCQRQQTEGTLSPPYPWPIAIMGFAKMVGFHVVVGCSFLTVTDVEKLGSRRLGESLRAPRLTR